MDYGEERIAFYSELGLAITQWAHVEFALSWVVGECFVHENARLAIDGLLSIDNFRAKIQYADKVVSTRTKTKKAKADWATLRDRAMQLAGKRNKLAHRWVLTDLQAKEGRRIKLLSSSRKPSERVPSMRVKYPGEICVRDIAGYQLEFVALSISLENFWCRLGGHKEQYPKSREQPKRPPTIPQIRKRIYDSAQHPPKPSRA